MRILHVVKELGSGGIQAMIMNLYRNIEREKFQFDFVLHWHGEKGMYEDEVKTLGGKIYRFYNLPECNWSIYKYQSQWKCFLESHTEYDIIHAHYMSHEGMILEMAKKYNITAIAHSHSTIESKFSIKKIYTAYLNRSLSKNADYILACSKQAGIDFYGKSAWKNRGIYIRNAIDTDDFKYNNIIRNKVRAEYKLEDNFVIGHVGNYIKHKNQDFMLKVFANIAKKRKDSVLVWAGHIEQKDMLHLQELIRALEIEQQVILLGKCDNISAWMQAFDLFFFPSLYEGFGIVLVEAQCAGLKCIVSDAIPQEAVMTNLVIRCNLDETIPKWVKCIMENEKYERKSNQEKIKQSGFDINENVLFIEKLYENRRK